MANNTTELFLSTEENISECLALQSKVFIPWNNNDTIVSFQAKEMVKKLKDLVFLPITFLIGVPANVINMAVFYKQGLKERINICLFALSFADCSYLVIHMLTYGEHLFYLHFNSESTYGPVTQWITNHYVLGLFAFAWVSQVMSAIVASERCFCVLCPLKSQTILGTFTMTVIIVTVFMVVIGVKFISVTRFYIVCAYDPLTNSFTRTIISREFYYKHKKLVDFLEVFMYGVGLPWVVIVVVVTTTTITVIKLRQAAQWRAEISSSGGMVSTRDIALTRMLVGSSALFILCIFPVGLFRIALLFMPEMNPGRQHSNLFFAGGWVVHILTYINATLNIVIYYAMGSRYRQIFWALFGRKNIKNVPSKTSAANKSMSTGV